MKTNQNLTQEIESIQTVEDGSLLIKFRKNPVPLPPKVEEIEFKEDRVSQAEAADMFNVTVQTIIAWGKKGKIKPYKIGRPVYYRKSELLVAAKIHNSSK